MSRLSLALAVFLVAGCSMIHRNRAEFKPVSEADFGRLQPNQLGPVDQARSAVFGAHDEVSRAKLRLQQAENEVEMARADQTAARAVQQRAQAQQDAAKNSNDPSAKAQSQEAAAAAELQARSAQGHMAYAQKLVAARQAEVDAADRHVAVREAELERARLTALTEAGVPAATKYNPATFDARVAGAQQEYAQRKADADQRLSEAQQNENAWRALHAQYQARMQGQARSLGAGADGGPAAPPPPQPAAPGTTSSP